MGALDRLREALQRTNSEAFQGLVFDHGRLNKEVQKLRAWLGSAGKREPPPDLMRDAVSRFYESLNTENLRDTRLVAFGCVEPFSKGGRRLIEDDRRFPVFLECVDRYRREPRPFRRCYKGLLNGYFTYDPAAESSSATGRENWERLRSYLHTRVADLRGEGMPPDWVEALSEHNNLTSDNPCERYGLSLLSGEHEEVAAAHRRLDISEASWITTKLVLSQVEAAAKLGDGDFIGYVTRLLHLLDKHPIALSAGLARVLIRYHGCADAALHSELRDFAVLKWGNPWLPSNRARWDRVPAQTRAMVADWLKLELIHSFFNLLAEDGSSDTRRLKFWERYHKSIDDMYFAIGRRAATSKSGDFRELRNRMQGRVLGLDAAGSAENNAFIMCMGNYVVVEFGVRGNACFIFRRTELPFELSGRVSGDSTALKHARNLERLLHIDRTDGPWETTFERTLDQLLTIRPSRNSTVAGGVERSASRAMPLRPAPPPAHDTSTGGAISADPSYSRLKLERFCTVRDLRVRDLSSKGGNLWVETDDASIVIRRQLEAWGFSFRQGRGWWRRGG